MRTEVLSREFVLSLELMLHWLEGPQQGSVPLHLTERLLHFFKAHDHKTSSLHKVDLNSPPMWMILPLYFMICGF